MITPVTPTILHSGISPRSGSPVGGIFLEKVEHELEVIKRFLKDTK